MNTNYLENDIKRFVVEEGNKIYKDADLEITIPNAIINYFNDKIYGEKDANKKYNISNAQILIETIHKVFFETRSEQKVTSFEKMMVRFYIDHMKETVKVFRDRQNPLIKLKGYILTHYEKNDYEKFEAITHVDNLIRETKHMLRKAIRVNKTINELRDTHGVNF